MNIIYRSFLIILIFVIPIISKSQTEVDLAHEFQQSLDKHQAEKMMHEFSEESRQKWHFFPDNMVERPGITVKSLSAHQKEKLFKLLAFFLSESGLNKSKNIIGLESVLFELEKNKIRDPELYYVAFFGKPGSDHWSWKFEGHHLSLNFTIVGGKIAVAPLFMGANPAKVLAGPRKGFRALDVEEDLAFELLNSLDGSKLEMTIISKKTYGEIITFNKSEVDPLEKSGLSYSEMNKVQHNILEKLIKTYLQNIPSKQAKERWDEIEASELNEVTFSWAGSEDRSNAYYYRIQGKTFIIEFDNTQNSASHIHSVWRDFDGDFGRDLIKDHYKKNSH